MRKRNNGRSPHVVRLSLDVEDVRDMVQWIDELTAYIIETAPLDFGRRTVAHLSGLNNIRRTLLSSKPV